VDDVVTLLREFEPALVVLLAAGITVRFLDGIIRWFQGVTRSER